MSPPSDSRSAPKAPAVPAPAPARAASDGALWLPDAATAPPPAAWTAPAAAARPAAGRRGSRPTASAPPGGVDAAVAALTETLDTQPHATVVVHDEACHASGPWLRALAQAAGQAVQRQALRPPGSGAPLAWLDHVDCPAHRPAGDAQEATGAALRVYSTDADTEPDTRTALTRLLLMRAQLVVVLLGEVPAETLSAQLERLRQWLFTPGWRARQLQLVPLTPSLQRPLAQLAAGLQAGTGVTVTVCRPALEPLPAWAHLSASWNTLTPGDPRLPHLATEAPMRPDQAALPPRAGSDPVTPLQRLAQQAGSLPGVQAACVFEVATSRVLAFAGTPERAVPMARRGTLLLAAAASSRQPLQLDDISDEMIVMGRSGSPALGLRRLASHPGLAVHLIFDPLSADWPRLRPALMALDAAAGPQRPPRPPPR